MGRRAIRIYVLLALAATAAFFMAASWAGSARAAQVELGPQTQEFAAAFAQYPCLGAPADYVAAHDAKDGAADGQLLYPERRFYMQSQGWWGEGTGDMTTSIAAAMAASHIHYEMCFPFMETWNEASGSIRVDLKLQLHEFVGGRASNATALGFINGGSFNGSIPLGWAPTQENEVRYVSKTRSSSSITKCGRLELRGHVNTISPNGGEEFFNSFGLQSLFNCIAGRTSVAQRGPAPICRSWYEQADYDNVTVIDDFRGSQGFRASEQGIPVVGDLKLKLALASGASKWLVAVNPNIHGGSFGSWSARGTGTGPTVTIPNAAIPSGPFNVLTAGQADIGVSGVNPSGGRNAGVCVLPFVGD